MNSLLDRLCRFRDSVSYQWRRFRMLRRVLQPIWFTALVSLLITVGFVFIPQAREILSIVAQEAASPFKSTNLILSFVVLYFSLSTWYFPRAMLYVRYPLRPPLSEDRYEAWRQWIPRVLGVLPILGIAVTFARLGYWTYFFYYFFFAALFVTVLYFRLRIFIGPNYVPVRLHDKMPKRTFIAAFVILTISFILFLFILASTVWLPQVLGSAGVLLVASAAWIASVSLLAHYPTYRYQLPSLFVIALIWAAVVGLWNDNHAPRLLHEESTAKSRGNLTDHLEMWLNFRKTKWLARRRENQTLPLFIVSAEGGGIRAAYWTASVLAELEDRFPGFACHVFAISGVSGGSLGSAVFAALISDRLKDPEYACDGRKIQNHGNLATSTRTILGQDFLSPTLAGMLFPDLIQRFNPLPAPASLPDRATYLEKSWETAWEEASASDTRLTNDRFDKAFLRLWEGENAYQVPSLFLNSTWVENGSRLVISNVRPEGSKFVQIDDLLSLINEPLRLSTAVHISARFTYVSPAATIELQDETRRAVDGGYHENSGALTASEILETVKAFSTNSLYTELNVRPVVLIISNDPHNPLERAKLLLPTEELDKPSLPVFAQYQFLNETLSPIRTLFNTRSARGYRADANIEVLAGPEHTIRFSLALTDLESVPLGWTLSDDTRKSIDSAVGELAEEKLSELATLGL